jgi:hypothetical protein
LVTAGAFAALAAICGTAAAAAPGESGFYSRGLMVIGGAAEPML